MERLFIKKFTKAAKVYVNVLLSWRGILTLGACALGILFYYLISWRLLQLLYTRVMASVFALAGHSASQVENYLFVDNFATKIDSNCTYIDLILVALPFVWRGDGFLHDLLRIIFFIGLISAVNVARLYFAIVWHLDGVPWKYAHDFVDCLIYYPTLVLIIFFWLKAMRLRVVRKTEVIGNEKQR